MKILVLADLHLDEILDRAFLDRLGSTIRDVGQDADALIIAGDLTEGAVQKWPDALRWLGTLYPSSKTVLIPGNHDYYGGNLSTLDMELERICRNQGCAFGQCRSLVLGDVRVLMATLWTDMRLFDVHGERAAEDSLLHAQMMPDYGEVITVTDQEWPLRPEDTIAVHGDHKAWLMSQLGMGWEGRTIVVTHHAPSASVIGGLTQVSPCFASNLELEIERYRPDVWLFGHTHRPVEIRAPRGTLLKNISVGYEDELQSDELERRIRRGLIDLSS